MKSEIKAHGVASMHMRTYRFDHDHYNTLARRAARHARSAAKNDPTHNAESLANHLRPWYWCAVNSICKN